MAFADELAATPVAFGAIGGGFFTSDPATLPAATGATGATGATAQMPRPAMLQPSAPTGPDLCGPAIARASFSRGLPPGLLNAMAKTESGRLDPQTGASLPWPWTIDANGTGFMYPSAQAAEAAARGFQAAGINSLDVGCLQVNLAQHPDAFSSLAQAFDPAANADYAARFLIGLQQKFGNWTQAVAAYHSQTPALGAPYAAKVYAQWQSPAGGTLLSAADPAWHGQMTAQITPPAFPALGSPQTAFQMSPLQPAAPMMMRQEHGATGRSLASYRQTPVAIATSIMPQG